MLSVSNVHSPITWNVIRCVGSTLRDYLIASVFTCVDVAAAAILRLHLNLAACNSCIHLDKSQAQPTELPCFWCVYSRTHRHKSHENEKGTSQIGCQGSSSSVYLRCAHQEWSHFLQTMRLCVLSDAFRLSVEAHWPSRAEEPFGVINNRICALIITIILSIINWPRGERESCFA